MLTVPYMPTICSSSLVIVVHACPSVLVAVQNFANLPATLLLLSSKILFLFVCDSSRRVYRRPLVLRGVLGGAPLLVHQNPVGEPQEPAHVRVPFLLLHPVLPGHQPARPLAVLPPQALVAGPQRIAAW